MSKFVQYDDNTSNKVLYTPCKYIPLEEITKPRIQALIKDMTRKMRRDGIGLAANQVGESIQLFLIECKAGRNERYFADVPWQVFINPRITAVSADKVSFWHGCLSALGHDLGEVATYSWIEYEAYNEKGEKITGRLDQMGAIIFQHEFRHMLGSCYLDHAIRFLSHDEFYEKVDQGLEGNFRKADFRVPLLLADYKVGETIEEYAKRQKV